MFIGSPFSFASRPGLRRLCFLTVFGSFLVVGLSAQTPVGTAFTYQGRLINAGTPATGLYDLRFTLYEADVSGMQVGPVVVREDIPVTNGIFSVLLDFGSVFTGSSRFLEVAVRPGASTGTFTMLTPRQELTPTPNAQFATSAGTLNGASCSSSQILKWDGVKWMCGVVSGSEIAAASIPFSKWSSNSCTAGQIPKFTGSEWQCDTDVSVAGGANTAFNGPNSSAVLAGPGVGVTGPLGVYGTGNTGVYGAAVARGLWGWAPTGTGALGQGTTGLWGEGLDPAGAGVFGVLSFSTGSGVGVVGQVSSGQGVAVKGINVGIGGEGIGVYGSTLSATGVGVYGRSNTSSGLTSGFVGSTGVWGDSSTGTGVYGTSLSGTGVNGWSQTGAGVVGVAVGPNKSGVEGRATGTNGVGGRFSGNLGLMVSGGIQVQNGGVGVDFGDLYVWKGDFRVYDGELIVDSGDSTFQDLDADNVTATTLVAGAKLFRIDHPLDPENKYLQHVSIESDEIKNLYDGTAVLDNLGEAVITMPSWFEALNRDFRYQLTPIGAAMPNLHIADEISNGAFHIAGGSPGKKVSWQVTGSRHDPMALANPIAVEMPKAAADRGSYVAPAAYGLPPDRGIARNRLAKRTLPDKATQ